MRRGRGGFRKQGPVSTKSIERGNLRFDSAAVWRMSINIKNAIERAMSKLFVNISRTAQSSQSSLSQWSVATDEATRAVALEPNGSYHFHTNFEVNPWWEVSLGSPLPVCSIEIYNRDETNDLRERACPLLIEYSDDCKKWVRLAEIHFAFGGLSSDMPLRFEFPQSIPMASVRLRLAGKNALHLDAVKIFAPLTDIPTKSQIEQERWVFAMSGGRRNGRFAEIGAFDGVYCSNTFHLETTFGWTGVEIEANPVTFKQLQANRRAICINKAVYKKTGEIVSFAPCGDVGTISEFAEADMHGRYRRNEINIHGLIQVETITFDDIWKIANFASTGVDYASVDTEGSELEILKTIDLDTYRIPLLTVEHNYAEERRALINEYMSKSGYKRVPVAQDDWFYHEVFLEERNEGFTPEINKINDYFREKYR